MTGDNGEPKSLDELKKQLSDERVKFTDRIMKKSEIWIFLDHHARPFR